MPEFQIEKRVKDNIVITDPAKLVNKLTDDFPFTRAEKVKLAGLSSESNSGGGGGSDIMGGKMIATPTNELTDLNFSGTDLTNSVFTRKVSNVNFSWANLTDVNFQSATISGCNFNGAKFINTSFGGSTVNDGTSFKGCDLRGISTSYSFADVDLSDANCSNIYMGGVEFLRCNLLNTNFSNVNFGGNDFSNYEPLKCNFNGASLGGVRFVNVDLSGSTFVGSIVSGTDFTGATMPESCNTKEKLIAVAESVDKYSIWIDGTLINPLAP